MSANDRILLIRTGGTIDSEPYPDPKDPPHFVDTLNRQYSLIMSTIQSLPSVSGNVDEYVWVGDTENRFVKDSQKFSEQDIEELANIIKLADQKYFVVTHGTDAMVKNASQLSKALKGSGKVVVFTGAMVPLSMQNAHKSDGVESLKFTLENIKDKESGVYIAAHGQNRGMNFFSPLEVQKDRVKSLERLEFTVTRA